MPVRRPSALGANGQDQGAVGCDRQRRADDGASPAFRLEVRRIRAAEREGTEVEGELPPLLHRDRLRRGAGKLRVGIADGARAQLDRPCSAGVAVPRKATVCGLPAALWLIVRVALRAPAAGGLKRRRACNWSWA